MDISVLFLEYPISTLEKNKNEDIVSGSQNNRENVKWYGNIGMRAGETMRQAYNRFLKESAEKLRRENKAKDIENEGDGDQR